MIVPRRKPLTAEIAVISVGLNTYWKQFPGLLDEMKRKTGVLLEKFATRQKTVVPAWIDVFPLDGVPGDDAEGVIPGIDFVKRVNSGEDVKLTGKVVVIGGGSIGADVARTAARCGAAHQRGNRVRRAAAGAGIFRVRTEAERQSGVFLPLFVFHA